MKWKKDGKEGIVFAIGKDANIFIKSNDGQSLDYYHLVLDDR